MRNPLGCGDEVCCLLVPELHLVAQHVNVQQLPDVLFPVILCAGTLSHSNSCSYSSYNELSEATAHL